MDTALCSLCAPAPERRAAEGELPRTLNAALLKAPGLHFEAAHLGGKRRTVEVEAGLNQPSVAVDERGMMCRHSGCIAI
jgi:hypothetical protein